MERNLIPDRYVGEFTFSEGWKWTHVYRSPMEFYPETLRAEGNAGQTAVYDPEIRAVGQVRISVYVLGADEDQPRCVEYEIHHNGTVDTVSVDPSPYRAGDDNWLVIGTFLFSGESGEHVLVRAVSETGITRLSTLRFEILNEAVEGNVWQYLYVGPDKFGLSRTHMDQLHAFADLTECRYRLDIEYLASLGVISKGESGFRPDEMVTAGELMDWFHRMTGETLSLQAEPVTLGSAVTALAGAARDSGVNLDWAGSFKTGEELFRRAEILTGEFQTLSPETELSRAQAAALLKRYYHTFVAAGICKKKWKLSFADDFNGEQVDERVWVCQNAAPGHILSSRWASNLEVRDGKLRLLTKKEKHSGCEHLDWTTGSISVKPEVFSQRYGYWQASLKINKAHGLNNAFWMIGNGNEIDVVEAHYPNVINTNYHHMGVQHSQKYDAACDLSEDFHVYAVEWNEAEMVYFFDGKEISRKENIAANDPLYPIFSTAVLNWAGRITDAADGCAMEVEWVRVYCKKEINQDVF